MKKEEKDLQSQVKESGTEIPTTPLGNFQVEGGNFRKVEEAHTTEEAHEAVAKEVEQKAKDAEKNGEETIKNVVATVPGLTDAEKKKLFAENTPASTVGGTSNSAAFRAVKEGNSYHVVNDMGDVIRTYSTTPGGENPEKAAQEYARKLSGEVELK